MISINFDSIYFVSFNTYDQSPGFLAATPLGWYEIIQHSEIRQKGYSEYMCIMGC